MPLNIVIPVKDSTAAKRRLGSVLAATERATFARYLYRRTLEFFTTHYPQHHLSVVTPSPAMAAIARRYGATVIRERKAAGLSAAAATAADWSANRGFTAQLLIPADIAYLKPQETAHLLENPCVAPAVILCPARDVGTNALLTAPPDAIPFHFGYRSSLAHAAAARQRSIAYRILQLDHLSHDIDTPADLVAYGPPFVAGRRLHTAS